MEKGLAAFDEKAAKEWAKKRAEDPDPGPDSVDVSTSAPKIQGLS